MIEHFSILLRESQLFKYFMHTHIIIFESLPIVFSFMCGTLRAGVVFYSSSHYSPWYIHNNYLLKYLLHDINLLQYYSNRLTGRQCLP